MKKVILVAPKREIENLTEEVKNRFPDDEVKCFDDTLEAWQTIVLYGVDTLITRVDMLRYTGYELATMTKRRDRTVEICFISADGKMVVC